MQTTSSDYSHLFKKRQIKTIAGFILTILSYHLVLSPASASSVVLPDNQPAAQQDDVLVENEDFNDKTEENKPRLPINPDKFIIKSLGLKQVSAYNVGDPNQTDGSPCTTANGENICLALELGYSRCAANFVPFGTVLEINGFGRCLVTDRMNSRYQNHVDLAMKYEQKKEALKFGRKKLEIKVIVKPK